MLLRYHGFNDWKKMVVDEEREIKDNVICFGFELEVTQDKDISFLSYEEKNHSPVQLANKLHDEFGDLFVYERDSSIGNGIEIISQPMSLKYYFANIDKFKKLLQICNEWQYVSTKGGKCGLHFHFSRSAFGFQNDYYEHLKNTIGEYKANKVEKLRVNKTIENISLILEIYKKEFIKLSGRNQYQIARWSSFNSNENHDILKIKTICKEKSNSDSSRYRAVNTTNLKTIEIRLCRGTLLWESFHTRLLMMYHLVDIARNFQGLLSFKKIVEWKEDEETILLMRKYIEENNIENKRIDIDNVKNKVSISLDTEFRIRNEGFMYH